MDLFEASSSTPPPPKDPFLETYPTTLHSSYCLDLRVFWSHDDPQDKITCAFQRLQVDDLVAGLIQFWAPVSVCGRRLLTTSNQPFALSRNSIFFQEKIFLEHRLYSLKYRYDIDHVKSKVEVEDEEEPTNTIITNGPPASAFLNRIPELLPDLRVHLKKKKKKNALVSSALRCGLLHSAVVPVFDPSKSECVGVVECSTGLSCDLLRTFNKLIISLENQGLKTFHAQHHLPYKTICSFQNAKDEIDEALKIISQAHDLPLSQVWIPYEDENQVAFSSSLQHTRANKLLWLKLAGHSCDTFLDDEDFKCLEDYGTAHYRLPMKVDGMFAGKTLENYESLFIQKFNKWNDDNLQKLSLSIKFPCSYFVICLRSTKTGDLDYLFEFLWSYEQQNSVILLESLLLKIEEYLPSFKLASGTQFRDGIDVLDVNNSTRSENKYIKIFERKTSLKRGRQPKVEECLTPLKARGKTAPIELSREQIESQFGQIQVKAAKELGVHLSTLKRKCTKLGIKWQGKDSLEENQSETNEEDNGGAIQDNTREASLDKNVVTIKAEYAGDVIMFTHPIPSATSKAMEKEIVKRYELDPATRYKLQYLDVENNEWILFTCDENVTLFQKDKRNVRLRLLTRDPSHT